MISLKIAFSPLNDAALVLVAEALGFYESEGLSVTLSREPNWSNIRDKLAYGMVDAAHILAPVPLAAATGLGPAMGGRIIAPMALGANGNAVLISNDLKDRLESDGQPLGSLTQSTRLLSREVDRRRREGLGRLVFGVPLNFSAHHFVLRHWVAAAGLDPERHIQWVVVPPSRMADMVKDGVIDAYTSGSPWPQAGQLLGRGTVLFSDPDFWSLKPEKVLAVQSSWAEQHPAGAISLVRALLRAAMWVSDPAHSEDLIRLMARQIYVDAPADALRLALAPANHPRGGAGLIFDPQTVTFPWISHAKWFLGQLVRWNFATPDHDFDAIARSVYRPDMWREAAGSLRLNLPLNDEKDEGGHPQPWSLQATPHDIVMPPNVLFDGGVFRCA